MRICKNCGTQNLEGNKFCVKCGEKLETPSQTIMNNVSKVQNLVKDAGDQLESKVNSHLEKDNKEKKVNTQPKSNQTVSTPKSTLSSSSLWTWLIKNSKSEHFYNENHNDMRSEEYLQKLQEKIQENNVPAVIKSRDVQWDLSDVRQEIFAIEPTVNLINPLTCSIQFSHVGKFTFVEEKTYITPPNLPKLPEKPVEINADAYSSGSYFKVGIGLLILGFLFVFFSTTFGLVMMLAGGGLTALGYMNSQKLKELQEHNERCKRQEYEWNKAWDNWETTIFAHSFQESVFGEVGRIYDAIFECIKQLNEELFKKEESVLQEDSKSMNELEELISRRKQAYR